jgi:hypothetical protein
MQIIICALLKLERKRESCRFPDYDDVQASLMQGAIILSDNFAEVRHCEFLELPYTQKEEDWIQNQIENVDKVFR